MITRSLTADADGIAEAAALLRTGELVAFPTETVYGLGADATDGKAVAGIFAAKERPRFNPLIVHVSSATAAWELVTANDTAGALAEAFWPGALTMVLPKQPGCPVADLTSAGLDTLAVRVPAHPLALELLTATGLPVAAPSANRSGRISPTTAAHVHGELDGRIAAVLDGGTCAIGLESTVVQVGDGIVNLLRPGGVTADELADVVDVRLGAADPAAPSSPGQLESHYAPTKPLRLDALDVAPDEALLAYGSDMPAAELYENLSPKSDLKEAAANLYAMLRRLDDSDARAIAAMAVPDEGLGRAINDRLRRAAHGGHKS